MQLRFITVVPVYNHPATVLDILQKCLSETDHPVLIVDDGSDVSVESMYLNSQDINPRVHFIRHEKNKGKGAALLTATEYSVAAGYTHMVTIDADGQHEPADIKKLTASALLNPWAVILGDRQMNTANVPKSSVFGKAFSNFWVKYETDLKVSDSQSGFRIYPLFYLQTMKFVSCRYDFEVEVLTRMVWKGVEIVSVGIQVNYFPPEKRVTHFHKIKDNLRLVVLNTILVCVSLLKRNDAPLKSAFATSVGVFVGCLPLYGLHTFIIAALAFILRINFVYLFLGTQISIPPMVPVIILGAKYFSELLTGHPPTGFFGFSHDWILGIATFGAVAALLVGILVYFLKRNAFLKSTKPKIAVKSNNGLGIVIMKFLLKNLGLKFAYFCLYFVVGFYFIFSRQARKSSHELALVLDQKNNFFKRQVMLYKQLYTFAQVLVDRAFQRSSTNKKFNVIAGAGVESFRTDVVGPKGMISLLSHFGGWEMIFNYFQHMNTEKKVIAVMYGIPDSYQHTSIQNVTDPRNTTSAVIKPKLDVAYFNIQTETVSKLKEYLVRGDVVGIMGDRPAGRSYELIPVLGKLAMIDTSALRLSVLCNVKSYSVMCTKKNKFTYEMTVTEIDPNQERFQNLSREDHIIELAKIYASDLSKHLRKNPEQWFNFFPFWSEKNL